MAQKLELNLSDEQIVLQITDDKRFAFVNGTPVVASPKGLTKVILDKLGLSTPRKPRKAKDGVTATTKKK